MKESNDPPGSRPIAAQQIALPTGGGAIKGMEDVFQPNIFSGTGSYSIPLPITQGRGFEPSLSLDYNSASGNSAFGLGFSLSLQKITVNTNKGIPRYQGKDHYTLTGEGTLVEKLDMAGQSCRRTESIRDDDWEVRTYFPRVESAYSSIEQWISATTGRSFWKIVSRNNVITTFGTTDNSRIADPDAPAHIAAWLSDTATDACGNKIVYTYKSENQDRVPAEIFEINRSWKANRYLQRVQYGNFMDTHHKEQFAFELVFDYGEYELSHLSQPGVDPYQPIRPWSCRPDPFSSFHNGFEIRTYRLCCNILLFHHFEKELGLPCLVKRIALEYDPIQHYDLVRIGAMSLTQQVLSIGYRKNEDGSYDEKKMPPLHLQYSSFAPPAFPAFKTLDISAGDIPGYLGRAAFLPVDLHGEGLPGFLLSNREVAVYLEPLGDGRYSPPAGFDVFPISKNIQGGEASLVDLEGNGQLQMLVNHAGVKGYYAYNNDGSWNNYQPFDAYPDNAAGPFIEMSDIDGNGRTDFLMASENEILTWASEGKKGYAPGRIMQNEYGFPLKPVGAVAETAGFANIFGDGLDHRVCIKNGLVECWPCLGYGRYGKKITLGNAPVFDDGPDSSRLFFADVDGSGTTDLIYVSSTRVDLYLNQNGNSFSSPIRIGLPETYTDLDQINFMDINGNGTSCLVFTKSAPAPRHYYYDFVGQTLSPDGRPRTAMKPYLLNSIDNAMGSVTEIQYASSTKFMLDDKRAGKPWVTKLRFPVQVVEKITIMDTLSRSRTVSRFGYHDGYYDPVDREFRGFGFVESWDTETLQAFGQSIPDPGFPVNRINRELYIPPVYTKTWNHTGACKENRAIMEQYRQEYFRGDLQALDFPASVFDPAIAGDSDPATIRQAYAALAGRVLRKEVYADDPSPVSANPYTVEEFNFEVILRQPAWQGSHAAFLVNPRENIAYQYERNPDDPRIQQGFTLGSDLLSGETERSCSVFLPRRAAATTGKTLYPEQLVLMATLDKHAYIDTPDGPGPRWRGVPCEQQQYELFGLDLQGGAYFSYDQLKQQTDIALQHIIPYQGALSPGTLQTRQFTWNRTYFWNEAQDAAMKLQEIASRGLLHHQESAVFSEENIAWLFAGKVTDSILREEGGYIFDAATGYWQNKGLVQYYFNEPTRYFMASGTENSWADPLSSLFQKTTVAYDDYYLMPVSITQHIDETNTNEVFVTSDYQVMKPFQLVDINKNVSQVLFDPLGQVVVSSLFGTQQGIPAGGMRLYAYLGQPAEYIQRKTNAEGLPISFDDVIAHPEYYLQGAASYFFYNMDIAPATGGDPTDRQPASAISLVRDLYHLMAGGVTPFSCQLSIAFQDGLGRTLEKKQAVSEARWLVSGRTVYNNKGKVCEAYLPFFSDTANFETQGEVVDEDKVPPVITHYDPLSRVIRIDSPKGFFSKAEFDPWEEQNYDEDDTVKDSPYYIEYYPGKLSPDELDAINKALVFYDTPAIKIMDNRGIACYHIQTFPGGIEWVSCQQTDIQGRITGSIDARLYASNQAKGTAYYNFRYRYAMGDETPAYTDSADAGLNLHLNNVFGNAVRSWSARGFNTKLSYDRLERPVMTEVTEPDKDGLPASTTVTDIMVYGDTVPGMEGGNLRGQIYRHSDQAGVIIFQQYSLQHEVLASTRQLVKDYKNTIDWKDPAKVSMEDEIYACQYVYDALKRSISATTPDGSVTRNTYGLNGLLQTVSVTAKDGKLETMVRSIDYDAGNQRVKIQYGNGVSTSYTYEDSTRQLLTLVSRRPQNGIQDTVLQDIQYVYDPVGNITRVYDKSSETVFCHNQQVDPLSDYTYNAIYQLIRSSGRQHRGINKDTYVNGFKQSIYGEVCPPSPNDAIQLENYTEIFTYDDGGNLVSKQHIADSFSWTQDTPVVDGSNRLKDMDYDAAGNLAGIPLNNSVGLGWDYRNRLVKAAIIERPDQDDDSEYYNYDASGSRIRKVTERWAHGGLITQIEERIYLGNYEVKRLKTLSIAGEAILLDRQTLRVMDDTTCVVIINYWPLDERHTEVEAAGTRQWRYQLGNNLGSVSVEVDESAGLISYEEYFPYGGTAIIAGSSQREVALKDYRYAGKECDDSTGFYYYGARYYVTWLCRWLNPDGEGPVDGLNIYAFVKGNPIRFTDESGNISVLGMKVLFGLAGLLTPIGAPIAGAIGGAMAGYGAATTPAGKVAAGIAGGIGGLLGGAVLGAVNFALAPLKFLYDMGLHIYRAVAPEVKQYFAPATTYPAILYNASQRTKVAGVEWETGFSGAAMIAEERGIPRSLWPTLLKPYDDPALNSITGSANFNGQLIMVGHGTPAGQLEVIENPGDANFQSWGGTNNWAMHGLHQNLAANGLNWTNVTSIDMSICYGTALANPLQATLNAVPPPNAPVGGHDITIRASDVSVGPLGQIHSMGVIRDSSSSVPGEILHWLTFGIFRTASIESSLPPGGRLSSQQNGRWFTIRS